MALVEDCTLADTYVTTSYFPRLFLNHVIRYRIDNTYIIELLKLGEITYVALVKILIPDNSTSFANHHQLLEILERLISNKFALGMRDAYTFSITVISAEKYITQTVQWALPKLRRLFPDENIYRCGNILNVYTAT
jgi:hypothetical protein